MGGDHGPHVTVPAALQFQARVSDVEIVLVGVREAVEAELAARGAATGPRLRVQPASQVVAMDEPPAQAMRYKKDSSMRVAVNLVKSGAAHACVSAGNTGAVRTSGFHILPNGGRLWLMNTRLGVRTASGAVSINVKYQ